jgi:hypothetical protein
MVNKPSASDKLTVLPAYILFQSVGYYVRVSNRWTQRTPSWQLICMSCTRVRMLCCTRRNGQLIKLKDFVGQWNRAGREVLMPEPSFFRSSLLFLPRGRYARLLFRRWSKKVAFCWIRGLDSLWNQSNGKYSDSWREKSMASLSLEHQKMLL